MEVFAGLLGAVLGALAGGIATYATTRSTMRLEHRRFREDFHNWYFGAEAGGMFLTQDAKNLYMELQYGPERAARGDERGSEPSAAQPPRLRWTRLGPTIPPPSESPAS
jgi:hypothetical protein